MIPRKNRRFQLLNLPQPDAETTTTPTPLVLAALDGPDHTIAGGPVSIAPGPAGPEGRLPACKRVRRPRSFPHTSAAETAFTTLEGYQ
jgi:hypothetical protein